MVRTEEKKNTLKAVKKEDFILTKKLSVRTQWVWPGIEPGTSRMLML